ncbi:MAG: hypothetical protein EBR67_07655 [Proteobacteria bacterium]|nr:hypothetical protein [Pseudomonadota bacterium]
MLKNLTTVAVSLLGMAATSAATLPTPSFAYTSNLESKLTEVIKIQETATKEVAPTEKTKEKRLTCIGCNSNELTVLNALQERGITDKLALATVMGNIKQESQFIPDICEGGSRVSYSSCRSGGFGIIQFTSSDRFYGLGEHAKRIGGDPSSFDTQLDYVFTEKQWQRIEEKLKLPNQPINFYMRLAHSWLGWGIKGPRESYAYEYLKRFTYQELPS